MPRSRPSRKRGLKLSRLAQHETMTKIDPKSASWTKQICLQPICKRYQTKDSFHCVRSRCWRRHRADSRIAAGIGSLWGLRSADLFEVK